MMSTVARRSVFVLLVGIALFFFAATVAAQLTSIDVLDRLDTGNEGNPPTFFSASLLIMAGCLCVRLWLPLGIVLILMAVDEVAQVHEAAPAVVMDALETVLGLSGTSARLVAAAATLVVAVAFLLGVRPWYRSLPAHTRLLVAASTAIYISGALGLELLARLLDPGDEGVSLWLSPVEELLEMGGVALFIYALWPVADAPAGAEVPARSEIRSHYPSSTREPTTPEPPEWQ
jgi:hypothetical protein